MTEGGNLPAQGSIGKTPSSSGDAADYEQRAEEQGGLRMNGAGKSRHFFRSFVMANPPILINQFAAQNAWSTHTHIVNLFLGGIAEILRAN